MLCHAVLCSGMLCIAMLCIAMLYWIWSCCAVLCQAVLCCNGLLVVMLKISAYRSTVQTQTKTCLQDKMLSTAVADHVLWPLAKAFNAKLVPKIHQHLVKIRCCAVHAVLVKAARHWIWCCL